MRFIFRVRTLRMQYNQGLLARSTNMIHTVKQEWNHFMQNIVKIFKIN